VIESGSVVGEVGLEDIEVAIPVIVRDGRAHAGLLAPILIESDAGIFSSVGEGAVVVVVVEDGRGGVAGHVDVGPAVLVGVDGRYGEAVMAVGLGEAAFG